eukprot:TRINITY_DN4014_c1_g1_i13.p1 TRINITY_DN4014_c1_g1~~TRINITY_DN4014_c1_g1_i13.p1  ORF type:complete len:1209 (+),score=238.90 TRINITY_DN4014_c1_g1_i13:677-4303(+)
MRLWGHNTNSLHVASGTIYNEIIVWKLVHQSNVASSASSVEVCNHHDSSCSKDNRPCEKQYMAITLSRLIGHEGSIFRIAWSPDGSKLTSVSDDRSARVWTINAQRKESGDLEALEANVSVGLILFGHNARVWDCYISDSVIITAGEDCTCRVWGLDGNQLLMVKEHIGRGIWRCLFDPSSSLLITAGFDSAIKIHPLPVSSFRSTIDKDETAEEFKDRTEIITIPTLNLSEQFGLMDSKSEYVRCLCFAQEDILYVATNHGYLYHVKVSAGNIKWHELVRSDEKVPTICMDLLSTNSSNSHEDVDDWIATGDGRGNTMVVGINSDCNPKVVTSFTWTAEKERQLLGTYWSKSLGCRCLFTTDPRGKIKLWRLDFAFADGTYMDCKASLLAEFTSSFGMRIMCVNALFEEEVLACGDQRGNLIMFPLSKGLLLTASIKSDEKISSLAYFKGAHGISSVASILIATLHFNQVEICSTGGDGCICYFKYNKDWQTLEFMGMKQVKELSLVQSIFAKASSMKDFTQSNYAVGFASTDFIIWNLVNDTKVLQIPCGGWRRPHSYFLGDTPEIQSCFAYLKNQTIHIHRLWVPASERIPLPRVLHLQFHGREIHSLCLISVGMVLHSNEDANHFLRLSWIATGCEDGTVRLTRYTPDVGSRSVSRLLGEHVGGSAVRSICFISKIHTATVGQPCIPCQRLGCDAVPLNRDDPSLLISVGAKRILTSWLLWNKSHKEEADVGGVLSKAENSYSHLSEECTAVSFQWLSTHMPPKFASTRKGVENMDQNNEQGRNISIIETGEQYENDWRYLAVTAFLVKGADQRLTFCFVVVACSDATLALRALLLPSRLWFDVAVLAPQTSPVLALQHVVIPIFAPSEDKVQIGSVYIVISGSTDGAITFWDLTETVESFMQRVSTIQPEKVIDCQRRPRTGRGSQGGRWWRSLTNCSSKTCPPVSIGTVNTVKDSIDHNVASTAHGISSEDGSISCPNACSQSTDSFIMPEVQADDSLTGVAEIGPLHVLASVHRSGVNCLHVSNSKDGLNMKSESIYYILSGGDDQALHSFGFDLVLKPTNYTDGSTQLTDLNANDMLAGLVGKPTGLDNMRNSSLGIWNKEYRLRFLSQNGIASGHSSAVKGVWTDGTWVFSTGLDQRVRCWCLSKSGKLTEHAHLIISVPEPETLDARACGRNQYQIVVGGRGMQMVEFSALGNTENEE